MTAKEVKPSSRARENAVSTVSKSKQRLRVDKDANQRIKKARDSSRRHPVISDAEIHRYLHDESEMQLKKFIWEVMNKNHVEIKRPVKAKKLCPAKELVKTDVQEENKKRLSSRINYDALKKLNEELDNDSEEGERECLDSSYVNKSDKQQDAISETVEICSSGETDEHNGESEIVSEYDDDEELDTNRERYDDEDQGFEGEYFFDDY